MPAASYADGGEWNQTEDAAVTESSLPAWIYKRDGRLVPFEPDNISQSLFAAAESLGQPNAFLARELTEGVLHFLAQEEGATPTTALLSELVVKVVRELGQPGLAQAFASGAQSKIIRVPAAGSEVAFTFSPAHSPDDVVASCLRAYSLHAVFARNLAAAQQDGLLSVIGLDAPLQLAACVPSPDSHPSLASGEGTFSWFLASCDVAHDIGNTVCLDGPEYTLATEPVMIADLAMRSLVRTANAAGRNTVVNVGCQLVPAWAREPSTGPLFAEQPRNGGTEDVSALADSLLGHLIARGKSSRCRVDWHLGEVDFAGTEPPARRLVRLSRLALEWPALTFTFDRPRRPVVLGEGLDRAHRAVLLAVGLHLPRLVDLPGVSNKPEVFLQKLGTLARLAHSAAVQKRNYLRRQGKQLPAVASMARGFLLERARLLVIPIGLEESVRRLTGCSLVEGNPGLELGRQVIERLREVLQQEGRRANLDSCIDGIPAVTTAAGGAFTLDPGGVDRENKPDAVLPLVAGLTPWAPAAPPRSQLRVAGVLHAVAGGGTAALFLSQEMCQEPETVAQLLQFAWRQTEIVRLRLLPAGRPRQAGLLPP